MNRENFGNEEVAVEQGKKENRSDPGFVFTFKDFLDVCCELLCESRSCLAHALPLIGLCGFIP